MVTVARNKVNLKKRIERFFNSNNSERALLCEFLDDLNTVANVYIFGGVVRDIALRGVRSFRSDIDVVIETDNSDYLNLIQQFYPEQNKFGGYRLLIEGWSVDLWEVDKTWAFAIGLKSYDSIDSLLETTITNWDSALYDWSNKKLIANENYVEDIQAGYLDVNLSENPNELGMIVKILRFCADPNFNTLSGDSLRYLRERTDKFTFDEIYEYEKRSYNQRLISVTLYSRVVEALDHNSGDLLPAHLDRWFTTKQICFE